MIIHFKLNYATKYGQQIFILSEALKTKNGGGKIPMQYVSEELWSATVVLPGDLKKTFAYHYLVENEDGFVVVDGDEHRFVNAGTEPKDSEYTIFDKWIGAGNVNNLFFTKPFEVFYPDSILSNRPKLTADYTHEFRVKAPLLGKDETICLLGSTPNLKSWDEKNPIIMKPHHEWYIGRIKMDSNEWPASYKYAVYNTREKQIISWEAGDNRKIGNWPAEKGKVVVNDGFAYLDYPHWKGTGVNVPVFSLRSKKSFGSGEFSDIKPLVDWCTKTGIRLIQLLPVNDTSVHDTWRDSYPYAAISAFALHPIYLNLDKVAGKDQASIVRKLNKKKKQLNDLPGLDYEQVMQFKRSVLREIFEKQKDTFKKDTAFKKFFKKNQSWLEPYAAFCYLKERNQNSDYTQWKSYSVYNAAAIKRLVSSKQRHYNKVVFYYYEQYHLHQQLTEVAAYAHRNGVVLKGDLPIGLHRNSCDVWMHPELFDRDNQAGAPPDDFAVKGQNWGFPIYNWSGVKEDNFAWWTQRLQHMATYFDAFRVDHILGYFRIWSIPKDAVEGIMGRFIPAVPIDITEFAQDRIYFDRKRYCQPYITDELLNDIFGGKSSAVISEFLLPDETGTYILRDEVNTQEKVVQYLAGRGMEEFREGLFELISNVILFEENNSGGQRFHFRFLAPETASFKALDAYLQDQLRWLYNNYFYERQHHLWRNAGMEKLPVLKQATGMMMCGEDLGMVPPCVPEVMGYLGIPGLNVARMSKTGSQQFSDPLEAGYVSIVQPSTHDMSTLRQWWSEDTGRSKHFYQQILHQQTGFQEEFSPEVAQTILKDFTGSPAMLSIFLLQDLLSIHSPYWPENPEEERINIPEDADHYWRYRMKIALEDLIKNKEVTSSIRQLLREGDRLH